MKKILIFLSVLLITIGVYFNANGGIVENLNKFGIFFVNELSNSDLEDFYNKFVKYSNDDYEKFTTLFTSDSDKEYIKSIFKNNVKSRETFLPIQLEYSGGVYLYNLISYTAKGDIYNNDLHFDFLTMPLKKENGILKLYYQNDINDKFSNILKRYYNKGFISAIENNRNYFYLDDNYMFIDKRYYYEGATAYNLRYAWQEDDGSVVAALWMANGFSKSIRVYNLSLKLNDKKLGTIFSIKDTDFAEIIEGKSGKLIYYTIPANKVKYKNIAWNDTNYSLNVKYK